LHVLQPGNYNECGDGQVATLQQRWGSHDCRTAATATATATATNGQKQQQETPITVHQLKIWLARLELAEVHIDKRLRVSAIINFIIIALS
jgi:hypothetical protein